MDDLEQQLKELEALELAEKEIEAREWTNKAEQYKKEALNAFREIHWQWYIHYLFYRGEHYSKFSKSDGRVVAPKKGVTINIIRPVVRALSNSVSKLKLKTTIFTDSLDENTYQKAVKIGKYWDKKSDSLQLTKLYRNVVKIGTLTGAVPASISWDPNMNDGNGGLNIRLDNPFLTLPQPTAPTLNECNWLIRIVNRSLIDLQSDITMDEVAVANLKPEQKLSESPIFDQVVQLAEKLNNGGEQVDDKSGSVWVTELYVKERIEGQIKIRKVVTCQNNCLSCEITDLEDFPIEWFVIEEDGISLFPEAWVKDLIPLVQAINKHETQLIEYIDRLGGAFVKLQGGKIKINRLEDGTKVYEIDGQLINRIDQVNLPPMPSNLGESVSRLRRYFEDIGAFTEVSRGMAPTGATSGEYLKALMAGDSNNTVELKENLTDFATRLTKKALWYISKYQNYPETKKYEDADNPYLMTSIGKDTPLGQYQDIFTEDNNSNYGDILEITSDNDIRIEIDSDITHTLQSKQEELTKLYQLRDESNRPIIPLSVLLKSYGFGSAREVIEELEKERLKNQTTQMGNLQAQDQIINDQARMEMGMPPNINGGQ